MSARRSTRAAAGWTGMEAREPGEPEGCSQESAALVGHALLDYLIRTKEHCRRDRQPERLGGLKVDHQFELRGLLDGEVGGFGALENPIDEAGRLAVEVQVVDAIGDEAAGLGARAEIKKDEQAVPSWGLHDPRSLGAQHAVGEHQDRARAFAFESGE